MIGKIQRLRLRDVWRHEARDFTTWLENNIDVLNDALDLSLVSVEHELSAVLSGVFHFTKGRHGNADSGAD